MTTGYRVVLGLGWSTVVMAAYLAGAAAILDSIAIWWLVAGLALSAMLLRALLPDPVPREYITGGRNEVGPQR